MGVLDVFARDKGGSSLEIAGSTSFKTTNDFLRIQKKIGHMVNLEATR